MLLFCHLLSGLLVGLIVYYFIRDKRVIPLGIFGAILPDLIDKPLGHIILGGEYGGRLFFHGLWVALVLLIIGIFLYIRFKNPLLIPVAAGVFVHQILDSMWNSPVDWLWPLLGPYPEVKVTKDYFYVMLLRELSSPVEILCFVVLLAVFVAYFYYSMKKK